MKPNQCSILVVMLTLLSTTPAGAVVMLDLIPTSAMVDVGDSLSVDIVVSGLGAGGAPSVGTFDFDITYDDSILAATGVDFGLLLGDSGLFETIEVFDLSTSGLVDLFEVSFLFDFELDALQPDSFTLATLNFDAIGLGASALDFTQVILGDAFALSLDPIVTGASATVGAVDVPSPDVLVLLLIGFISMVVFRPGHQTVAG